MSRNASFQIIIVGEAQCSRQVTSKLIEKQGIESVGVDSDGIIYANLKNKAKRYIFDLSTTEDVSFSSNIREETIQNVQKIHNKKNHLIFYCVDNVTLHEQDIKNIKQLQEKNPLSTVLIADPNQTLGKSGLIDSGFQYVLMDSIATMTCEAALSLEKRLLKHLFDQSVTTLKTISEPLDNKHPINVLNNAQWSEASSLEGIIKDLKILQVMAESLKEALTNTLIEKLQQANVSEENIEQLKNKLTAIGECKTPESAAESISAFSEACNAHIPTNTKAALKQFLLALIAAAVIFAALTAVAVGVILATGHLWIPIVSALLCGTALVGCGLGAYGIFQASKSPGEMNLLGEDFSKTQWVVDDIKSEIAQFN